MSELRKREVLENIDATIDDPFRIPTRTTFGKGTLTYTDNGQATFSIPLHLYGKNPGSVGGNVGQFTDTIALSLNPEINQDNLAALRDIYRTLVYPLTPANPYGFQTFAPIPGGGRWLYWKRLDGKPSDREPPKEAWPVGHGNNYEIFTTDRDAFAKFVLLTYGYVASSNPHLTVAVQPDAQPAKADPKAPAPAKPIVATRPSAGPSTSAEPTPSVPRATPSMPEAQTPIAPSLKNLKVPPGLGIPGSPPNTLQDILRRGEGVPITTDPLPAPPNIR